MTQALRQPRRLLCAHLRRLPVICMLILIAFSRDVLGQNSEAGGIRGTVTDSWQGSPVPAVIVTVRGTTLGAEADGAGNYVLSGVPAGAHTLILNKNGYERLIIDNVKVVTGITSEANAKLGPIFFELDAFEAVTEPIPEQQLEIFQVRQDSLVMADSMGSEMMSKMGVNNAAEALTKVTGATIVEGKFAVIRGLSDRYTAATLAGMEIPSADPYRKSAQLDLFPSAMIERIEVNKTFTPDQPGGFTGGSVNLVPRSIPQRPFFKYTVGGSYNMLSTGQDLLAASGGDTDWLGMDSGARALPDQLVPGATQVPTIGDARFDLGKRAELIELTKSFTLKEMGPTREESKPNHSFSLSGGDRWKVASGELGYYATLSYNHSTTGYEDGNFERHIATGGAYRQDILAKQSQGVDNVSWGAAFGMGWQRSDEHELSFTFLNTQNGQNSAYRITGFNQDFQSPGDVYEATTLQYTERSLRSFLFRGKHEFVDLWGTRFDWQVANTATSQEDPDLRVVAGVHSPAAGRTFFDNGLNPSYPSRYWRDLQEHNLSYRLDLEIPFVLLEEEEGKFKFGYNSSHSTREFLQAGYGYISDRGYLPWSLDGDYLNIVPTMEAGLDSTTYRNFYVRPEPVNIYDGEQRVTAQYGMVELPLGAKWTMIGGGRAESTFIAVDSTGGLANLSSATSEIQQTDLLPAIGAVYKPVESVNVRVHYSQTIARPTYREIANVATFDFIGAEILIGNPNLRLSQIKNFDVRAEWFPAPGNVLSFGGFYKQLTDPIELFYNSLDGSTLSYQNRDSAIVIGWEAEARANLGTLMEELSKFSVGVNYAWIQSTTELTPVELNNKRSIDPSAPNTRPMYDQSPFIANADLTYENPILGLTTALIYNVTGPRLAIANPQGEDVYEHPGNTLDLSITKQLNARWKLKFSARNLLDPTIERTYGVDKFLPYSSFTRGRSFGIQLSGEF